MRKASIKDRSYRLGMIGAAVVFIGTLISGPLSFLVVSRVAPQPAWENPALFVNNFHPIQSVTYYFGLLLLFGTVLMITSIHALDRGSGRSLLALIFTAIAAGLVSINYMVEASLIPALVRSYSPSMDPLIQLFAVQNPSSLFWVLELWGYGYLGLGSLFASYFFSGSRLEILTKYLFVSNGVLSLVGALVSGIMLEWVLSTWGLISYALWNLLYLLMAVCFLMVFRERRTRSRVG